MSAMVWTGYGCELVRLDDRDVLSERARGNRVTQELIELHGVPHARFVRAEAGIVEERGQAIAAQEPLRHLRCRTADGNPAVVAWWDSSLGARIARSTAVARALTAKRRVFRWQRTEN